MDFTEQVVSEIHDAFDEVDRFRSLPRKGLTAIQAANEYERRWRAHSKGEPDPDGYMSGISSCERLIACREGLYYGDVIDVLYKRAIRKKI